MPLSRILRLLLCMGILAASGGHVNFLEQLAEHPVGIKKSFGDLTCGAAMRLVILQDALRSQDRLFERAKRQQALANGQRSAEAGVLNENGFARREITGCAVAE